MRSPVALFIEQLSRKEDVRANLHQDQPFLSGMVVKINWNVSIQGWTFCQLAYSPATRCLIIDLIIFSLFYEFFSISVTYLSLFTFYGTPQVKGNDLHVKK